MQAARRQTDAMMPGWERLRHGGLLFHGTRLESPRGVAPVFLDDCKRLGIGRGRRSASQVLGWLSAGDEQGELFKKGLFGSRNQTHRLRYDYGVEGV